MHCIILCTRRNKQSLFSKVTDVFEDNSKVQQPLAICHRHMLHLLYSKLQFNIWNLHKKKRQVQTKCHTAAFEKDSRLLTIGISICLSLSHFTSVNIALLRQKSSTLIKESTGETVVKVRITIRKTDVSSLPVCSFYVSNYGTPSSKVRITIVTTTVSSSSVWSQSSNLSI